MIESIKQFVKMADYDSVVNRIIVDETQIANLQQEKENVEAKLMLFARKYEELYEQVQKIKEDIKEKCWYSELENYSNMTDVEVKDLINRLEEMTETNEK